MNRSKSKLIDLVCFAAEYRGIEDITIPPSGCLYVGDALKKAGFTVRVHHLFSNEIEEAIRTITVSRPLFVGFSIITGSPLAHSAHMSHMIKKSYPHIPLVWGGVHPSLMSESCLREDFVDFVVRGEGEITVTELAKLLYQGGSFESIDGLGWKDPDGRIHINQDRPFIKCLDQFGQDWTLVDPIRYVRTGFDGTRYISFITSRGCPHNCGFCYNLAFNKRRWRAHSVEYVVESVQKICHVTGVYCVGFNDDNFFVDELRAFQILERLQKIGVHVSWLEIRLDQMDEEVLSRLSKNHVRTLFVGWESGSDKTLKRIDKGFDTCLILKGFSLASKYSFGIDASAILGFPFETESDWKSTIDMVLKIDELNPGRNKFNIGVYVPYPGTPIVKEAIDKGFKFPDDIISWNCFDILKGNMKLPWISSAQIRRFALMDRYAKMLYTGGDGGNYLGLVRKLIAYVARLRLRYNVLDFPIEALLYDQAVKLYLKYRMP